MNSPQHNKSSKSLPTFAIIVAVDAENGIGLKGKMPWHLSADLKYFSKITQKTSDQKMPNAVIMGRTTWESIPEKYRPLPKRLNIVLTHQADYNLPKGVLKAKSLDQAFKLAQKNRSKNTFVIGGGSVFEQALIHPACQTLYVTRILKKFKCDTFFPKIDSKIFSITEKSEVQSEKGISFEFIRYFPL
ncbi:MAG: dihydrofolate reductase [Candidatus Peregrinibacteria bacterium GW2011_GWF2_39_17]|nr:MAG: dihydrofolate reductase [Candidatus Peregrinibacteria bacterium GW2011_GWF2_39_17]HCW32031.1 hypothetical protein [Candidatus Peregrinibacteria bacterium]